MENPAYFFFFSDESHFPVSCEMTPFTKLLFSALYHSCPSSLNLLLLPSASTSSQSIVLLIVLLCAALSTGDRQAEHSSPSSAFFSPLILRHSSNGDPTEYCKLGHYKQSKYILVGFCTWVTQLNISFLFHPFSLTLRNSKCQTRNFYRDIYRELEGSQFSSW